MANRKNQPPNNPNNPNNPNAPNAPNAPDNPEISIKFDSASVVLLVVVGIFGFFLSLIYMFLMQKFPKPLIKITLYLSIAFYFATAAIFAYFKEYFQVIKIFFFGKLFFL